MRLASPSPSSIKIIATGGKTSLDEKNNEFINDLKDLVDFIDPDLTLRGIYEILKEQKNGEK